ncbi:MAG TPA: maleylpyruvate isomerase N-terminal domain-containing protein, partial [Microbacterium sp.]|nr:maleylpyruvate isomerase N-terminal domain-containing protein [Microbacterium sp.]
MTSLTGLITASRAFASLAAYVDADAPVRSEIWPTAGAMIDHLGNIQSWATRVVSTGAPADRKQFTRPPERERVEWFRQTSDALVEILEMSDPGRECWAIWGAQPVVAFWRRRMTNEAAKHLWDLRTA